MKFTTLLLFLTLAVTPTTIIGAEDCCSGKPVFSGQFWGEYWHAVAQAPATGTYANAGNGTINVFYLKRAQLNAIGKLDDKWTYRTTFEYETAFGPPVYLKFAFVRGSFKAPVENHLTFGMQPNPLVGRCDEAWGYRALRLTGREMIQTTVVGDALGLKTLLSSDLGVGWKVKPLPHLTLNLLLSNGGGFRTPESDMYKKAALAAQVTPIPTWKDLVFELTYDTESGYHNALDNSNIESRSAMGVFAGVQLPKFGLGLDYYQKSFPDKVVNIGVRQYDITASVISVFGNYYVMPKLKAIARYDAYTPVTDEKYLNGQFGGKSGESILIAGLDCLYGPPNAHFVVTYQTTSYEAQKLVGANWIDRDPFSMLAVDWIFAF